MMKKILLTIAFSFGLFANLYAQETENKSVTTQEQPVRVVNQLVDAKKNITDLKAVLKMSTEVEDKVFHLFLGKYKMIMGYGNLPGDYKLSLEENLKNTLGEASFKKVKSNSTLFESLMN